MSKVNFKDRDVVSKREYIVSDARLSFRSSLKVLILPPLAFLWSRENKNLLNFLTFRCLWDIASKIKKMTKEKMWILIFFFNFHESSTHPPPPTSMSSPIPNKSYKKTSLTKELPQGPSPPQKKRIKNTKNKKKERKREKGEEMYKKEKNKIKSLTSLKTVIARV